MLTRSTFARAAALVLLAIFASPPSPARSQASDSPAWDDPRTLELLRRGIERRSSAVIDESLQSYAADAQGYVYFLLDAPELERQTLVRTDQVAVQIFWRSPNDVRQRIVGMRERKELPVTRLYYYLDRLTVVQDNYGRGIVIADGDNVNDVPHPVATGAEAIYSYRLVDSVALRLPGAPDPVQVHEIQVRPRDSSQPAILGSIFLEERTGALVRMSFSFTPSAYIDPRLDFIHVTLENGLWEGRYWLPYEQRLEIRREIPELDLPFGTIIRTRMRIGEYRFNEYTPDWLFSYSAPITMAPRAEREHFEFEQSIDAEWRLEGIGEPLAVSELRKQARELAGDVVLSGLPGRRLGALAASDVLRYNRAEGAVLGAGIALRPLPESTLRLQGGWAFGAKHPLLEARMNSSVDRIRWSLGATLKRPTDLGGKTPPVARLTNSLGTLFFARDWLDPYYTSGGELQLRAPLSTGWSIEATGRLQEERSAQRSVTRSLLGSEELRPVRAIDDGVALKGTIAARRELTQRSGGAFGGLELTAGHLAAREGDDFTFGTLALTAGRSWALSSRRTEINLDLSAGTAFGRVPRQELTLLGGRGTLPGFDYRSFGGDRFALGRATLAADLTHPWLRGRVHAAAGWTGASHSQQTPLELWGTRTTGPARASVGAGVGLFYDLLRLDVARGLGSGGRTEVIFEIHPGFWDFL